MKKKLSLILALTLCMALAVPAFAMPLSVSDDCFFDDALFEGTLRLDGEDVPVYAVPPNGCFWLRPSWVLGNGRKNGTLTSSDLTVENGVAVNSDESPFRGTWAEWKAAHPDWDDDDYDDDLYWAFAGKDSPMGSYGLLELEQEGVSTFRVILHFVADLKSVDLGKTETVTLGNTSMTLTNVVGRTTKTIRDDGGNEQNVEVLLLGKGGGMVIYSAPDDIGLEVMDFTYTDGAYRESLVDGYGPYSGEFALMYTPTEIPMIIYRSFDVDGEYADGFYFMMASDADTEPQPAAKPVVVPTAQKLTVNGTEKNTEIYNIDGSNYFKLRDMAALLNGTGSQFSVGFDGARNTVVVKTGEAYAAVGGELATGTDKSASAALSTQSVEINGEKVELTAFNIGGNNFFKLRELGTALGFGVDYDAGTATMLVTSK